MRKERRGVEGGSLARSRRGWDRAQFRALTSRSTQEASRARVGRDGRIARTSKVKRPRSFLERAARGEAFGTIADVAAVERPFEFMMNALRLNEGVDAASFAQRTGLDSSSIATRVAQARARGWLLDDPARLVPSELGRRYLNDVVATFLPETSS